MPDRVNDLRGGVEVMGNFDRLGLGRFKSDNSEGIAGTWITFNNKLTGCVRLEFV